MIKYLLTIIFILSFLVIRTAPPMLDGIIAVVGDNIVMYSDYGKQMELYKSQGLIVTEEDSCKILEELLTAKLLINQAAGDSIEVDKARVEGEVEKRIDFFAKQSGGIPQVERYFKKTLKDIKKDLFIVIKEQMLQQEMMSVITGSVIVTPKEVKQIYKSLNKDSIDDVEARYKIAQIQFEAEESEVDKTIVIDKLTELKERLEKGEDFSALAVLYSQDEVSAAQGGRLGFLGRGELVPEYAAAAFRLSKGEISEIVKTKFGYHVIRLEGRRGKKVETSHILLYPKFSKNQLKIQKSIADSVYELLKKKAISFKEAASDFSTDESSKHNSGIITNPSTRETFFNEGSIQPYYLVATKDITSGKFSKPIYYETPNGKKGYRIVKLIDRVEKHKLDIEKDYEIVKEMALEKKKEKKLLEWLEVTAKNTYIKVNTSMSCNLKKHWIKQ